MAFHLMQDTQQIAKYTEKSTSIYGKYKSLTRDSYIINTDNLNVSNCIKNYIEICNRLCNTFAKIITS